MKKEYKDLLGEPMTMEFPAHDISKYNTLYHVTLKKNRAMIEKLGLRTKQPQYKSLVETDLLFFSYPITGDTTDLFRFSQDHHCIVVLDANKLHKEGYLFYDDLFSQKDQGSKRNHLATDRDIPNEFIIEIVQF